MKLVLASNNPGKLREIQALVAPSIELLPQSALGITEAEEPHQSFVENALAKAQHASRAARLPALADGSENRVLKNFPSEKDLRAALAPHAARFAYRALEYYWLLEYELK